MTCYKFGFTFLFFTFDIFCKIFFPGINDLLQKNIFYMTFYILLISFYTVKTFSEQLRLIRYATSIGILLVQSFGWQDFELR